MLYADSIISLNAQTGMLNWSYQAHTSATINDVDFGSTPNLFSISVNGTAHQAIGLGSKDGAYYILDRTNGSLLERFQVGTGGGDGGIIGLAGFIYRSGTTNPEIFIPSYYNPNSTTCCGVINDLNTTSNTISWQFITPAHPFGSVAVIPGAVLFGDNAGNFYAVSTTSGLQLFHKQLSYTILGGVTVAEGLVLVPAGSGPQNTVGLYAFSP